MKKFELVCENKITDEKMNLLQNLQFHFQYWFGEEACTEARAFVDTKHIRHYPVTIEEEYDPRYPGAHLAL